MGIIRILKNTTLIFTVLAAIAGFAAKAQTQVGSWMIYTPFVGAESIAETSEYVYYLSSGALYRIDKETQEVMSLNMSNYLNDTGVTGMYVDNDSKSVIVTYGTGNMDRLFDNGKIINLPDIKDATLTTDRTINCVAFGADKFYVATNFGLITYNDKKNEVMENMLTPNKISNVFTLGDLVGIDYNNVLDFAPQSQKLISIDQFKAIGNSHGVPSAKYIVGVNSNQAMLLGATNSNLLLLSIDEAADKFISSAVNVEATGEPAVSITNYGKTKNGFSFSDGTTIFIFNSDGSAEQITIPAELAGTVPSYFNGLKNIWFGSKEGMCQYDLTGSSPAMLAGPITGSNLMMPQVHRMHVGSSGKIYAQTFQLHQEFGLRFDDKCYINEIENGVFKDVSPYDVTRNTKGNYPGPPYDVRDYRGIFEDPDDPEAVYIPTFFEGVYRVKNGVETHHYSHLNSSLFWFVNFATICSDVAVDKAGNLWVLQSLEKNTPQIHCLPAAKRTLPDSEVQDDWVAFSFPAVKLAQDGCILACRKSNKVLFLGGRWSSQMVIMDTKGQSNTNQFTSQPVERYLDQDNKELAFNHMLCAVEDERGRVWIGTDNGVFEISDLDNVTNGVIRVNHLKVPRNDGTNLADYLLDTQKISSIAIDPSDRKWITTIGSGVYLVSESGDEILEHYTSDNSILPTNNVYSVACDPATNRVYFAVGSGLVEYSATTAPGQSNYNDVVAYPNPVRPDYNGWITVSGLMENSLVKIADASGNVVNQGRSNGGMYIWDGCNSAGERVKTGVYFVFASQNATGTNQGCVTKIMVIN